MANLFNTVRCRSKSLSPLAKLLSPKSELSSITTPKRYNKAVKRLKYNEPTIKKIKIPTIKISSVENYTTNDDSNDLNISINTPDRNDLLKNGVGFISKRNFIGRGRFGTVISAFYKKTKVAAKIVRLSHGQNYLREENIVGLNHFNIINVIKVIHYNDLEYGIVIMEHCAAYHSLHDFIEEITFVIDDIKIVKFSLQICNGLNYCHRNKILHLDIKPKNILIRVDGTLKICDFGSSINMNIEKHYENYTLGTPTHMAPEIIKGYKPTEKSDVYSFGITMWQLESRKIPYFQYDVGTIFYKVVKFNMRPQIDFRNKSKFKNIYLQCWHEDPKKRPSVSEIINCLSELN